MHVHQFWWVWSFWFQRYGYPSKTAKFPFRPMDYSPWSSKNLINRNELKKLMQVGIDVKFIHTNFGGCSLSGFRDIATQPVSAPPVHTCPAAVWRVLELWPIVSKTNIKMSGHALSVILILTLYPPSRIISFFSSFSCFLCLFSYLWL